MPFSTIINKLFVKGSGSQAPSPVEITANSVGAISTAPGFLTGKASIPVGTTAQFTVMLYAGDPTFQQLVLTANINGVSIASSFILEGASNPAGTFTTPLGWTSLQYVYNQANTSTGTGNSGFIAPTSVIAVPSGRTGTYATGIAGMSYVRLRLNTSVTTNPLELAWTVITTSSVPPVPIPAIGSGVITVDGAGIVESITTGSSNANPVLATASFLSQGPTNTWVYQRTPNTFKTVTTAALGNTAVWTPTAGKKFRLMRFIIDVTANASQAVAGLETFSFQDAAVAIPLAFDVFVPGAAGAIIGEYSTGWVDLGNGYLSSVANNVLNLNLTTALATGTCRVTCCGTEE